MSCPRPTSSASVGTANSGVPRNTMRTKANLLLSLSPCERGSTRRAALRRLREFLGNAGALELRDVVDKQNAVGVIDLVLQHAREQSFGLDQLLLAVDVDIVHPHLRRPRDLLGDLRDGKTAFLVHDRLVRRDR